MESEKTLSKDLNNTEVCRTVQEILDWESFNDNEKRYFIQSFLLNWVSLEDIKRLTKADMHNVEADKRIHREVA